MYEFDKKIDFYIYTINLIVWINFVMFCTFPQPLKVDAIVRAQFVEVHGLSPEDETKLWKKYNSVIDTIGKEKLHRFSEMESALREVWEGVQYESDKTSDMFTMNVMLQRIQCRETGLTDDELYHKYLEMKVSHFKTQIELYEKCFNAFFKLERKKHNYGLKIRGINRTDIPVSSRYSVHDVHQYICELEHTKGIYDKNLHMMDINLNSLISNKYIQQVKQLWIETFEKQKQIHLDEIKYYNKMIEIYSESNARVG